MKLKVEINSRKHFTVLGFDRRQFSVESRWFSGGATILTYRLDELLGTKVRALYQRKKGRDLFDLWKAFVISDVDPTQIIVIFHEHSPTWFSHPFTQARRAELVR